MTAMTKTVIAALMVAAAPTMAAAQSNGGAQQAAQNLNVDERAYSVSELATLRAVEASDAQDWQVRAFREQFGGEAPAQVGRAQTRAGAKAQIAGSLGVSADDYSLRELIALKSVQED